MYKQDLAYQLMMICHKTKQNGPGSNDIEEVLHTLSDLKT